MFGHPHHHPHYRNGPAWHPHHQQHGRRNAVSTEYRKKASTLAGWSNLPGKALLVDQLARLRARSAGPRKQQQQLGSLPPIPHTQQQPAPPPPPRCCCPLTTARCHCCRCSKIDVFAAARGGAQQGRLPWSDRRFVRGFADHEESYWHREGAQDEEEEESEEEEREAPEWLNVEKSVRFSLPGSQRSSPRRGGAAPAAALPPPAPLASSKKQRRLFFSCSSHEIDRGCEEEEFFPTDFVRKEEERLKRSSPSLSVPSVIVKTPLSAPSAATALTPAAAAAEGGGEAATSSKKGKKKEPKSSFAQRFLRGDYVGGKKKTAAAAAAAATTMSTATAAKDHPVAKANNNSSGGEGSDPGYESDPANRGANKAASPGSSASGSPLVESGLQQRQQLLQQGMMTLPRVAPASGSAGSLSPVTMELFVPIRVRTLLCILDCISRSFGGGSGKRVVIFFS